MWAGTLAHISMRTFVIEILQKGENYEEAELRIYKILLAMRLYKEDDVFVKVIWYEKESKVSTLTILDPPLPERMPLPYVVDLKEINNIRKLTKKLDTTDFNKRISFRIACERFNRSYEEHKDDEKIIDFMIAFESLFLKGEKAPANIGQFIGLGCSMLLGNNDKEREEINEFLVRAYTVRNKIVHGSEFIANSIKIRNETYEIEDFISQLQEYLRKSIKKLL